MVLLSLAAHANLGNLVEQKARDGNDSDMTPPSSPMDLMMVYLSPQMGVGQRLRLSTIQARLSKLPLVPTLDLLAQAAYRADATIHSQLERATFAEEFLPPVIGQRAAAWIRADPRYGAVSSQAVSALALHALVHCPIDGSKLSSEHHARKLGELVLAMAGLAEDGTTSDDELLLELVRLELWFRLSDLDRWFEVGHRLVLEVLPSLKADVDWIDVGDVILTESGVALDRFLALTCALGLNTMAEHGMHVFPRYLENSAVPQEQVDAWAAVWTISLADARQRAIIDSADAKMWTFSAFYDRPLLQVTDQRSIVMRPWFLANKGTPTGFYSLIERILRERHGDTLRWSRLFGKAVEALGRQMATELLPGTEIVGDETEARHRWGPGQACDTVILGDRWVAVDFVHRRISLPTATTGTLADLARDLTIGAIDKLMQIDATITRALATDPRPPEAVYPLVVVGAPFPVNGLVMNEIDRMLDARNPHTIGSDPRCRPPAVMDLEEYWMLLETAQAQDLHPSVLLERWISSPLALSTFRNWTVLHGPGQPENSGRRYWDHARNELFGTTGTSTTFSRP